MSRARSTSSGQVELIGLRSTRLRLVDGDVVIQPNMAFIGEQIENLSLRPFIRRELELALPYDSTPEEVERALDIVREVLTDAELAEAGRFDLDALPPRISFKEFEESHLGLRAYYWFHTSGPRESDWFEYLDHGTRVNVEIVRRFAEAGIEMAFPTRTIHLASGPAELLGEGAAEGDRQELPDEGGGAPGRGARGRAPAGRPTTPVTHDAGPDEGPADGDEVDEDS
jgi:MscS family membrane protein